MTQFKDTCRAVDEHQIAPVFHDRPMDFPAPLLAAATLCLACAIAPAAAQVPDAQRRAELVRLVRQECGSCHGMRLAGGLGPALTRQALADKPAESLVVTILQGRPGTPMPPWRAMLGEADAQWIVAELLRGFPEQTQDAR